MSTPPRSVFGRSAMPPANNWPESNALARPLTNLTPLAGILVRRTGKDYSLHPGPGASWRLGEQRAKRSLLSGRASTTRPSRRCASNETLVDKEKAQDAPDTALSPGAVGRRYAASRGPKGSRCARHLATRCDVDGLPQERSLPPIPEGKILHGSRMQARGRMTSLQTDNCSTVGASSTLRDLPQVRR